jgi:hypothetical protein
MNGFRVLRFRHSTVPTDTHIRFRVLDSRHSKFLGIAHKDANSPPITLDTDIFLLD